MPPTARRLADALAALPVEIDAVHCVIGAVAVPSYPDEPRPTSTVTLAGRGQHGRGEHVGWTVAAHEAFARGLATVPRGRHTLGALATALAANVSEPYDRAALEAAAIDLALRQAGATLGVLAGVAPRPLRYVVSFARCGNPAVEAHRQGRVELKVDADPAWNDATFAALAAAGRVAVLDWKRAGSDADHVRGMRHLPDALVEDPGADPSRCVPALHDRLSLDAPIGRATDLEGLAARPAAVNLKPARMGGVLEALRAAAWCEAHGVAIYLGGMFELGVGRTQLQALAAVLAPEGPNDVAPIARAAAPAPRPERLAVTDEPGFGT